MLKYVVLNGWKKDVKKFEKGDKPKKCVKISKIDGKVPEKENSRRI